MSVNENIQLPDDRRYTAEHTWAKPDEGYFLIGISDYAQDQLNGVMFVDLPEPGKRFVAGEIFGCVESVKSVNDLFMPLSGVVVATNDALADTPTLVNSSPYTEGWMVCMQADKQGEFQTLLSAEEYRKLL